MTWNGWRAAAWVSVVTAVGSSVAWGLSSRNGAGDDTAMGVFLVAAACWVVCDLKAKRGVTS